MAINSTAALRQTAIANAGIFGAAFTRAPKSVTFKGKQYLRDSAVSVEQRLWYLAACAQVQPRAIASITQGSFSIDEVFGLDPDRSGIDDAEREARAATAKVGKVKAQLDGIKRRIRDAEANLVRMRAAQKEAQKVQVGDIFTAGISAAGRNLYADGQVKIWEDRIEALKTGSLVGMAGQEGWTVPLNMGQTQLEGLLMEAKAEERAAQANVAAARAAYNEEAKARRTEEERARQEQATDARARAQEAAEARAREEQAARDLAAANQVPVTSSGGGSYGESVYPDNITDPSEVYEDGGEYYGEEESGMWEEEQLDQAKEMFGDGPDALAYAQDVMGISGNEAVSRLSYVSPYSFDAYYGADCPGCDGCDAGGSCDNTRDMRAAMVEAGWGNGQPSFGYDADESGAFFADGKITEDGDQGSSSGSSPADWQSYPGLTPPPMPNGNGAGAFDFAAIIPLIISAVLMLAPLIIGAFAPPSPVHEAVPPKDVQAELAAEQAAQSQRNVVAKKDRDQEKLEAGLTAGALLFAAVKVFS